MIFKHFSTFFLSLLFFQTLASISAEKTLNISQFLYPKIRDELRTQTSPFLEEVLKAISTRQEWDYGSEDIRVSELDARNGKFASFERYTFRIRIEKTTDMIVEQKGDVPLWTKMKEVGDFESSVKEVSSGAVLDTFRVKGPVELILGGDDKFSLLLPLNSSHAGLKRILVGEGITVDVTNAQEVSLVQALELGLPVNKSGDVESERSSIWPFQDSLCRPLLPMNIAGSVTVSAYRTRNPDSYIKTAFPLKDTIELLPEKCYARYQKQHCPIDSLNSRITAMEEILRSFLVNQIGLNAGSSISMKANIKASTEVCFQIELERDVRSNDSPQGTLADWRTRPSVERVSFEVVAKVEEERLKPITLKKVRPFIEGDSSAWSNLMSNMSFTNSPSVFVPPEALTLDVKW